MLSMLTCVAAAAAGWAPGWSPPARSAIVDVSSPHSRAGTIVAAIEPAIAARNALMHRSVQMQLSAFASVHDLTHKQYLAQQWSSYLVDNSRTTKSHPGELTSFLGHLQRSPETSVFVPRRPFRQLSPGNPYLAQSTEGDYEELRPTAVALRLMSCREAVAEDWVELMPSLAQLSKDVAAERDAPAPTNGTNVHQEDMQLLLGIATKIAAQQMLRELELRPSCRPQHDWLKQFVFVQHVADLGPQGSVERFHASLVSQPICIRGGALVDPLQVSLEIFERSSVILEIIERDLREAPSHVVSFTSSFLTSCLLL